MCAHRGALAMPWRCPGSLATGIPRPLEEQHGKNAGRKGQLCPKCSDWEEKPTTSPHVIPAPSLREAPPADPRGALSARSPALFGDLCTTEPLLVVCIFRFKHTFGPTPPTRVIYSFPNLSAALSSCIL